MYTASTDVVKVMVFCVQSVVPRSKVKRLCVIMVLLISYVGIYTQGAAVPSQFNVFPHAEILYSVDDVIGM